MPIAIADTVIVALHLIYSITVIGMMIWVPEVGFLILHFGSRLIAMWHDYQTIKISQARIGN